MPHSAQRRATALFIAALLASVGLTFFGPQSPAIADASAPSWWNGKTCDTDNYPGSYTLGASYNGVQACGPGTYNQGGTDTLVHFYQGAWGEYEWECTELVTRYMYLVYGVPPYAAVGSTIVDNYNGDALTKVANDGTSLPSPGDIISFAGVKANPNGHTAVVTAVNVTNGSGTVTIMEQNATANGWGSLSVSSNKITTTVLGGAATGWLHSSGGGGSGSGGTPPASTPQIFAIKRTTDPSGVRQVYAGTNTAVTEGWWIPGGDGVHLHEVIRIDQHNIVGFDKVNLPDNTQAVYAAVSDGVWESWWKPDGSSGQAKIVTGLSGVKGVIAYNDTEGGQFVHHLYILAGNGPYEAWWKDGGDGVHLSLLTSISGGVTFTMSIGPDGAMQLYVAVPTWVYEVWWHPGLNDIHVGTVINIAQGDIRSLSKGDNLSDGGQLLYTGTSTTAWQSYWNTGTGVSNGTIATGQVNLVQVKKTVTADTHQLYVADSDHVQEYWWNSTGSGGGELIRIPQNNIGAIDKVNDGAAQELYTGASNWVYETWWGGGYSPSTNALFSVAH